MERLFGAGKPGIDTEAFGGIDDIDEVVRDAGTFEERGFGGPDVEATVDLDGVGSNDLGANAQVVDERMSQGDSEGGFTARGRADDDGELECGGVAGGHGKRVQRGEAHRYPASGQSHNYRIMSDGRNPDNTRTVRERCVGEEEYNIT